MRIFKFLLAIVVAIPACGGASRPPSNPEVPGAPATAPTPAMELPVNQIVNATVYDAAGQAMTCGSPEKECAQVVRNPEFLERCRLAGFQVRRCGCADVCSGKLATTSHYFDATGAPQTCLPEAKDCTPPETSAKFQDDCEAAGSKLVLCGCQWLCSGALQRR